MLGARSNLRNLFTLSCVCLAIVIWHDAPFARRLRGGTVNRSSLELFFEPNRPIEGRMTGISHAPYASDYELGKLTEDQKKVVQEVAEQAKKGVSEAKVDLAVLELLSRRPSRSVQILEEAVSAAPNNAPLLSDLSAIYLARAEHTNQTLDYLHALSASTRAVRIAPGLPEAHFNRAIALTRLSLSRPASEEWLRYLSLEDSDKWKSEARTRLKALHKGRDKIWANALIALRQGASLPIDLPRIVDRNRWSVRTLAEEELFYDWAMGLHSKVDKIAVRKLDNLIAVGAALAVANGDLLVRDSSAAIINAEPSHGKLADLVEAHYAYWRGRQLYRSGDYSGASKFCGNRYNFFERQVVRSICAPNLRYLAPFFIYLTMCMLFLYLRMFKRSPVLEIIDLSMVKVSGWKV